MRSGSSLRGLSEVTITMSAPRDAMPPISGRFAWSLSPPHPKTTIKPSRAISRALVNKPCNASGVCAKSTTTSMSTSLGTDSNRPGTVCTEAQPLTMRPSGTPSSRAAVIAASAFITAKEPPIGRWTARLFHVKETLDAVTATSLTFDNEYDDVGTTASVCNRRP